MVAEAEVGAEEDEAAVHAGEPQDGLAPGEPAVLRDDAMVGEAKAEEETGEHTAEGLPAPAEAGAAGDVDVGAEEDEAAAHVEEEDVFGHGATLDSP